MAQQRLELTWYNKDKALIPTETGKYGYTWVDPADPRYCETHTLVMDEYVQGEQSDPGVYGIQHPITGEMVYPPSTSNWRLEQKTVLRILQGWANYDYGHITSEEFSMRRKIEGESVELRDDIKPLVIPGWNKEVVKQCKSLYENKAWPLFMLTKKGLGGFRYKRYLADVQGTVPGNLFRWQEVGHSDSGKKEIKALFPEKNPFSTPKPERLLERIIHIGSNPGDVVLDVFGGSGTTAAVAQKMGRRWVTCELLENTFNTFTRPRLEKVVNNQDPGGITRTKGERVAADDVELPEGVSPDDAAKFVSVLNKLIADDPDDKNSALVKKLKKASKTKRTKDVINWRGGGGFQIAHLSPACFDYDKELDRIMLTNEATGQVLIESVAANLGFQLLHPDDDSIFDGWRGNSLLKVYEGLPTNEFVDQLVAQLKPGERIVLASTRVPDGIREYLRKSCKGSRLVAIPDGIFSYTEGGDH